MRRRIRRGDLTLRPTNACKDPQSTKKPVRSTEVTMPSILTWLAEQSAVAPPVCTYHLAFVRPPHNCLVMYNVFSGARARHDFAIGYVERVQDAHYGVFSSTRPLLFLQQFAMDVLANQRTKVRRMQLDRLLEFFEKKHIARYATGLTDRAE